MKLLWFVLKRDVSHLFAPSHFLISHPTPPFRHVHFPALVKPSSGPLSWSKTVRRRKTKTFTPTLNQIADPEPGSFQHKAHVGIDEGGNVVAEGGVDRKWTDVLGGPVRPKVSFTHLEVLMEGDVDRWRLL